MMSPTDQQLLETCRAEIETRLGWGPGTEWSNQDFELLSDKIMEKAEVRLSISTLKRIWGKVKYENTPNAATLNALAVYLGYENWKVFRQQSAGTIPIQTTPAQEQTKPNPVRKSFVFLRPAAVAILIIPIVLYWVKAPKKTQSPATKNVSFSQKKLTDDLPNTVVFQYNLEGVRADSFFIQQNWDPRRRERISQKGNTQTSIYYYPGNFTARLIADTTILKQSRIFIQTKGWKGIIHRSPMPTYLADTDIQLPMGMGISPEVLTQKTGSPVFNEVITEFDNVREFDSVRLNHFVFETTLQNTSTIAQSLCRRVEIDILGIGTAILTSFSDKGCVSELSVSTGDQFVSGKTNDLSALGLDFSQPHRFRCESVDGMFRILIDDVVVFAKSNHRVSPPVIGIRIMFEGAGVIKNVTLAAPDRKPVYTEQF